MASAYLADPASSTRLGSKVFLQGTHGFERLAMLLLPILEALSTTFEGVPLFDGLKIGLFASLFGLAALSSRPPRQMHRGVLRWLLLILGLYTALSRLIYLGASGAEPVAFAAATLAFPALLWLLNASIPQEAFRSIMTWFVIGSAVAGLLSSGLALQVLVADGVRGWARVSMEVSSNRNIVAPIFVIALSALMFLRLNLRKGWPVACAGIILVALLLQFSRSGYIALAFPIILALRAGSGGRKFAVPLVMIAVAALVIPGSPVADRIGYTFQTHGANSFDDSAEARFDIWHAAIKDFEDNPFLGSGSGNSPLPIYDSRHDSILYDHNYFLTQLSQLGLVGFCLTIVSLVIFLHAAIQQKGKEKYFSLSFLASVTMSSVTGEPLYGLVSYIYYLVALHIVLVSANDDTNVVRQ